MKVVLILAILRMTYRLKCLISISQSATELLATKRRHNLSYSGAEDIMELAGVLAGDDKPFLPTRHLMKLAIQMYSCALTEHHVDTSVQKASS